MSGEEKQSNPMFLNLILSLQSAAWYQMGKIVSPISGKIERSLDDAKVSIDMLTMLQEKTSGNLANEERKILDNAVYTLQMNYIDEVNKDKENLSKAAATAEKPSASSPETADDETSDNGIETESPESKKND